MRNPLTVRERKPLHTAGDVVLTLGVELVSEGRRVAPLQFDVDPLRDLANLDARVVLHQLDMVVSLAKIGVPGHEGRAASREEPTGDIEGACLDCLPPNALLLTLFEGKALLEMRDQYAQDVLVEADPGLLNHLTLRGQGWVDDVSLGKVEVASGRLLTVVERVVLDRLGDEHRDVLDEDRDGSAVADALVPISDVKFLVELFGARFLDLLITEPLMKAILLLSLYPLPF